MRYISYLCTRVTTFNVTSQCRSIFPWRLWADKIYDGQKAKSVHVIFVLCPCGVPNRIHKVHRNTHNVSVRIFFFFFTITHCSECGGSRWCIVVSIHLNLALASTAVASSAQKLFIISITVSAIKKINKSSVSQIIMK